MPYTSISRLLQPTQGRSTSRYAIVDCAATEEDSSIYSNIISDDVEKYSLFTGETAWTIDHLAPYLLPLDSQPELEQWILEKGGSLFLTSEAEIADLVAHFKQYFELQAPNGRNIYFRYYDPVILIEFLPILIKTDAIAFFGPVDRFVMKNEEGEAVAFDKPQGNEADKKPTPSRIVLREKYKSALSRKWRQRLLEEHVQAYQNLGFNVLADPDTNSITIEDKAGAAAQLKKTDKGIETITGEGRRFKYELTHCKHPTKITDPAGNSVDIDIQERHNIDAPKAPAVINAIRMDGGEKTWVFDYDELYHLKRIDYPDGTHVTAAHNGYGHLTGFTDRNGNTRRMAYDFEERLTTYEDANGHSTRFDYDGFAAPAAITFADGNTFNFKYTDAGALETFLAGNTKVADYQVDQATGSWTVDYTDGGYAQFTVRDGKIVKAVNDAGSVDLAYDENGRLIQETFQNLSVTYHHNETGQLTGITTPFGRTIEYTLDREHRVCAIKDWTDRVINITYALNGALESITYPNRTRLEQKTNTQGMPTQMQLHGPEGPLFYKKYQRDLLNRVTQISNGEEQIDYIYDKEGRLLSAQSNTPDRNETFTLDAKANRLADDNSAYTYTSSDRICRAGNTEIHHDNMGNLSEGACPRGGADYTFTDLNKLKSISVKNTRTRYLYDAFGRRVAKKSNGITTRFYWAGAQMIHEADINLNQGQKQNTAGIIDYLYFPQTPVLLAIRQKSQTRYAAFGHRYEAVCLTNKAGQMDWHAQYGAYGKAHITTGAHIHQPVRLPGQYYDQESGLHYNIARYYDPNLGRFLSLDPLFLEGGSDNFYAYCDGDPINHIDPYGENALITNIIGQVVSAAVSSSISPKIPSKTGEAASGFTIVNGGFTGGMISSMGGPIGNISSANPAAAPVGKPAATTGPGAGAVNGGFTGGVTPSIDSPIGNISSANPAAAPVGKPAATTGPGAGAVNGGFTGGVTRSKDSQTGNISSANPAAAPVGKPAASTGPGASTVNGGFTGGVTRSIGSQTGNISPADPAARPISAVAATTLPSMSSSDFLNGAGASLAQQCAEAVMSGSGINILGMIGKALSFASSGPKLSPLTLTTQALSSADASTGAARTAQGTMTLSSRAKTKTKSLPKTKVKARRLEDHSKKCREGDPVTAVTGEVTLDHTDFTLPGRMPLVWNRHYGSQNRYSGLLGTGWQTPADARLEMDNDGLVTFCDGSPGGAVFDYLPDDKPVMGASNGAELSTDDDHFVLLLKSGITFHFPKTFSNDQSHVARISDTNGHYLSFHRKDGNLIQISDSSGQCIQVTCKRGRILAMQHNGKPLVGYRYDGSDLIAATDASGHRKVFEYEDGRLIRHMDKNKLSFYYTYDDSGRCTHCRGDKGLYEYRFDHRIYERSVRVTDSLGHTKTYVYDKYHQPIKEQDPTGGAVSYQYDEVGRLIKFTDPLDRSTEYEYDAAGNLLEIIQPDGNHVAIAYDRDHRPVQMFDANGHLWQQQFDNQGRLIERTDPQGESIQYTYNHWGDLEKIIDPEGRTTTFDYDDHGLVTAVTGPNNQTTRYQRNLFGQITAVIDPDNQTTRYVYDEKSRLIASVLPSGTTQRFDYDPEDNLILHTDPNGLETRFEYGGLNEIIRRINADGTTVSYQYDTEENLIGVTNEKNQTHTFTYDHAGRVTAQTDYYGQTTQYAYDPAGQLIQSFDPLKRTIAYAYDELGRLQTKTFETEEQETFHRDANGNLLAVQSPEALVEREYDATNNLTAEKHKDFTVNYQYDTAGRPIQRTTSHGNTVTYQYDAVGAVTKIQINDQQPVTIERNKQGRITKETISNYQNRSYGYDEDGLLTRKTIDSAIGQIERRYTYDKAANLIRKQDNHKGSWRFTHDPMGRITQAVDPEHQTQSMAYDPAGDLLEHMENEGQSPRSARYNNTHYQFDAAGNLTDRQNDDNHTRFTWDEHNRLKTIRKTDDTRITMTYDALGRRRTKTVNGKKTVFQWDGDALLSEQYEETPPREYVYYPGTFEPLAVIDSDSQVYYYQNDINGLPAELTKPSGDIVWSATYDAMGRLDKVLVDEVAQPLRMQGQYYDPEIDLCYNRYRYFDPQSCTFISQDPLGLAAGENVYAYGQNVWRWADPLGLETVVIVTKDPTPYVPVGWIGSHAAMYVNNNGNPAIYDPGGSYGNRKVTGSGDLIEGPAANVNDYFDYHVKSGSKTAMFVFNTTSEEEAEIIARAEEQGGTSSFQCAILTSHAISGIGPFKDVEPNLTPDGLYYDMKKLLDEIRKKKKYK